MLTTTLPYPEVNDAAEAIVNIVAALPPNKREELKMKVEWIQQHPNAVWSEIEQIATAAIVRAILINNGIQQPHYAN